MRWFFRRLRRSRATLGEHLDEAAALLEGSYLPYLLRRHLEVPSWAALNAAAHADLGRLRQLAAGGRGISIWRGGAHEASSQIAAQLCDLVGDDEELLRLLQRLYLVPLELRLIADCRRARQSLTYVVVSTESLLRTAHR